MQTSVPTRVEEIRGLSHANWIEIGRAQNAAFLRSLEMLEAEDWTKPTDCDRWDVKDIAAHVLGAAEGLTSFSELRRQLGAARKRKEELGNQLNAMNEVQVEDRRGLSPADLIERLRPALDRFIRLRSRIGAPGRFIPMYDPSLLGLTTVRYLLDTIYARDVFMHRIDIARATGRRFESLEEDRDLIADVVRDWARRAKPDAILDLTGTLPRTFSVGEGKTRITADAIAFCRVMSGRAEARDLRIDGDEQAAIGWLERGCPF